ncbi:uncharacterized protein LOC108742625 [Agrilus planipennis]|uniref:Uncharacterized protein LOC108742625 n=1 Tax=Agrilus planipennis TaxID=224129 RepID=A0A1W4XLZ5_AGRPL|nr:uncharacterized protein LOC108742625 [Agrilus planipennis]
MAPTLYYANASCPSRSVLLAGKALKIDFDLKPVNVFEKAQLKPDFIKINPQHTLPTLVEEDGFVLWDSHAINAYLVGKFGKDDSLYPKDLRKRAIVDQRLHFNNGTLLPRFLNICYPVLNDNVKEVTKAQRESTKEAYGFLEILLAESEYTAGNQLTIADFNIVAVLTNMEAFVPICPKEYPRINAWMKKMESLPYFNEVVEDGRKQFADIVKSKLSIMAPTLYYMEGGAPARSVFFTAKALGIELNSKFVNLFAGEHKKPEFLKINPQHTVPTLVDEDGFVLWDSHAITPYLVGKYAKNDSLYPKDLKKRAVVDQRLHFNNSVLSVRLSFPSKAFFFANAKEVSKEHADSLKEAYGFLEAFLDGNDYFAGDHLTIADFHIAATLTTADIIVPVSPSEFPRITNWLKRIKALPYYKDVNEKGLQIYTELINSKRA